MFKLFAVATYALATLSAVSGLAITRATKPASYDESFLESYQVYNTRYTALSCQTQHNTQFFEDCCHPLLKGQSLSDRPSYCTPGTATAVSSAGEPTPTDDDDDCEDGDDETTIPAAPTSTPAPAATSAPVNAAPQPVVSSSKPQATPTSSGSGQTYSGDATYFLQNDTAGACGIVHQDSDFIIALDSRMYSNGKYCGKKVVITDQGTGKTVTATVADECPTCNSSGSIDMSEGLFKSFHDLGVGLFKVSWQFA